MKTISIRELRLETDKWVRQASQYHKVVITERGVPMATLIPFESTRDSTRFISADRNRA